MRPAASTEAWQTIMAHRDIGRCCCLSAALASPAVCAGVFRGKDVNLYVGSGAGRALRRLRASRRAAISASICPAIQRRGAEHAGRQRPPADELHDQRRAQGRHRDRHHPARRCRSSRSWGEGQFDVDKIAWLGSANSETNVCMAWHTSPVRTHRGRAHARHGGRLERPDLDRTRSIRTCSTRCTA